MKLRLLFLFWLMALTAPPPAAAQSLKNGLEFFYDQLNAFPVPRYRPDSARTYVLVPGDFDSERLARLDLGHREVVRVDLVYSAFRLNPEFNQRQLNLGRLRSLLAQLPALANQPALRWNLIEQTGCTTPAQCQGYFHGFVLYTEAPRTKAVALAEADTLRRRLDRLAPALARAKDGPPLRRGLPLPVVCEYPVSRYLLADIGKRLKDNYHCPIKTPAQKLAFRAEVDARGTVLRAEIVNLPPGGCGPVLAEALVQSLGFSTAFRVGSRLFPFTVTGVVQVPIRKDGFVITNYLLADSILYRYGVRSNRLGCVARSDAPGDGPAGPAPEALRAVLARHPDWHPDVVVADATGSMLPYTVDLLTWLQLATGQGEHSFVFFNDGDDAPDTRKPLGHTGGLHEIRSADYGAVKAKLLEAMTSGGGGDQAENDGEALLRAHALRPEARQIVWLADNQSFPRDTKLLDGTQLPVRLVLCGATGGPNPKYLALARERGYSLHTLGTDLTSLSALHVGQVITVEGVRYEVTKEGFRQVSAP